MAQSSSEEEEVVEEFQLESHDAYIRKRTDQLTKVSTSLTKINRMQATINELVEMQGEQLNEAHDNVSVTKGNTKSAASELRRALANEKTIRDQICGCDCGIMCLLVWFCITLVFFFIDVNL